MRQCFVVVVKEHYRIILKEQLFDFNIFKRVLKLLCMFVCIGFWTSPTSSHFESRFIICPPPLLSLSSILLGLPPPPPRGTPSNRLLYFWSCPCHINCFVSISSKIQNCEHNFVIICSLFSYLLYYVSNHNHPLIIYPIHQSAVL